MYFYEKKYYIKIKITPYNAKHNDYLMITQIHLNK